MSKITAAARGQDCQVRIPGACRHDSSTTFWSHYRGSAGGKGMGHKSLDLCGAVACHSCDMVYDGQMKRPEGLSKADVDLMWLEGHIRSIVLLSNLGVI